MITYHYLVMLSCRGSGYVDDMQSNEPHVVPMDVKIVKVAAGTSHAGVIFV